MMQVSKYTGKGTIPSREPQLFIPMEGFLQKGIQTCLRWLDEADLEQCQCTLKLQTNQINYRSAIALALAGKNTYSPLTLAQQLSASLQQQLTLNLAEVQVTPPGWINFKLTATAIEQWLQANLTAISLPDPPRHPLSFCEYIRGRCFSILQLGITENIIAATPSDWKIPSFSDPNWLGEADWQFLSQLMATIDDLERPSGNRKLGLTVAHAFDQFDRHCQIFDRQQPHFPEISQLRLYLIALTQAVLAFQEA